MARRLLDAQGLWEYALRLLAARALSSAEVRTKLRRRAETPNEIDGVIARLRDYGYLNDTRFAESFAAARKETQGFGKARVARDLRNRRVAGRIVDEAVQHAFAGADETELAEKYLLRKFRNIALREYLQEEKHLQSAYRKLRYAGFSSGTSIAVLKRYAARAEEIDPDFEESSE
jgi:regulatory protein